MPGGTVTSDDVARVVVRGVRMGRDIVAESGNVETADHCANHGANGAAERPTHDRSRDDLGVCCNRKHKCAKNGACCKDSIFHGILL